MPRTYSKLSPLPSSSRNGLQAILLDAQALAMDFRSRGRTAAVVDLDRLYMMLDDGSPMARPSTSRHAREFVSHLTTGVRPIFVTFRVSVAEALRRVQNDTGRRASRIPAFLTASHASFAAVAPDPTDLIIDTTSATVAEVAATLMASLHKASPADQQ